MSPGIKGVRRRGAVGGVRAACAGAVCAAAALLLLLLPGPAATAQAGNEQVLVVGDSLAVGTEPYLAPMLGDRPVVTAIKSGITTPIGMEYLRRKLRFVTPQTVVLSLGSNDGSDPRRFANRLHRTLAMLPDDACIVWPTIIRPPRKGEYRGLNRVLDDATHDDARLVLVDWAHAVKNGTVHLRDRLHADDAGYRYRAAMIADAIDTECVARGLDGSS